jgi:4-hydroxyphenylacetate 3-monooxygenase
MRNLWAAQGSGLLDDCASLVEQCMSEYNLDGWVTPDFINPDDVNVFRDRG